MQQQKILIFFFNYFYFILPFFINSDLLRPGCRYAGLPKEGARVPGPGRSGAGQGLWGSAASMSPSGNGQRSAAEVAVMRKVIKIQNICKLLMRNLNDVIKEGNTGENVTHSWDFYSCIIISWKHFGYNTSSITGRGGRYVSRARPPAPHSAINGATSRATRRSAPVAARRRAAGAGAAQSGGSAAAGLQRALRSTTTLLTSGPRAALLWNFKKRTVKSREVMVWKEPRPAPACAEVIAPRADPQDCRHFPPPSPTACCNSQQCPQLAAWEQKGSPNQSCMQHVPYTAICVCVCLCSSFWKDLPISVSLNSSPECCLWALWGQKTLEGLIFKDLELCKIGQALCHLPQIPSFPSPPVVHGRNLQAKESSGAIGLQPYHRALTPRCPSDWTPCRDPTLPHALQFEFGRSEKQRATNLITVAANKARTIPGHSGL